MAVSAAVDPDAAPDSFTVAQPERHGGLPELPWPGQPAYGDHRFGRYIGLRFSLPLAADRATATLPKGTDSP